MDNDKTKPRKFTRPIGKSGTYIFDGFISNEEYNARLIGQQGVSQYDIMRKSDPTVRSTLQVVKLPVLRANWYLEPASEDELDQFNCEFLKRELFDRNISWPRFQREALTMLDFGHSIIEKTFEMTTYEGKTFIGIADLGYRKQTSILKWAAGSKPGVTQILQDGSNAEIPREKLMYFVFDQEGENYMGVSLLRYAFKSWDIKDKLELINAIALEKMSVGVPVSEVPADASPDEIALLDDAMREFRANENGYIRKPKGFGLEMLDLKANTAKDVLPSIKYYDRQIQLSVLAQFLSLGGADASGSRAVSEDHSKLFLMSEEALAEHFASVVQKELIEPLCDLNFSNLKNGYPQLRFGKIGDEDESKLGDYVQKLFSSGAMKYDPEIENHLRKVVRLPELTEEEIEERKEMEEEFRNNALEQSKESLNQSKSNPKTKEDDKDVQAAILLSESKQIRERLIGALPGA